MQSKARMTGTSPELLAILETAKAHRASPADIQAQRRSWVIGELLLDDPALTRADAEALYDEATLHAAQTPPSAGDVLAMLAEIDLKLPLRVDASNVGVVVDAVGRAILVADPDSQRPDEQVVSICRFVVLAANAWWVANAADQLR